MKSIIKNIIENDVFLNKIRKHLNSGSAYLAGGYIRDLATKLKGCGKDLSDIKTPHDRDIVLFHCDTENTARNIANSMGAAFVELDRENKIYRIVLGEDYADIAQGLNNNVDNDIDRRDFTINSIFYDLGKGEFYDKNRGFEDIETCTIRTKDLKNLSGDPLRMLRAYRFQSQLGFKIENGISKYIKDNAKTLDTIARERIHQEIMKMFEGEFLVQTLLEMYDAEFLEIVFPFIKNIKKIPPNTHHHLDLVHHSIETVNHIRTKKPLLKLAAFYHDIAKPLCWTIEEETGRHRFIGHDEKGGEIVKEELSNLKFSKKQIEYISKLVKHHIYPSSLMATDATIKAMARFIRKIHPDVEDLIELARADRLSARGKAVTDDMVEKNLKNLSDLLGYYESIKETLKEIPKLLDGKEIMEILNISAGPKLGRIINELKEAQISGTVKTKADAINFIKGL